MLSKLGKRYSPGQYRFLPFTQGGPLPDFSVEYYENERDLSREIGGFLSMSQPFFSLSFRPPPSHPSPLDRLFHPFPGLLLWYARYRLVKPVPLEDLVKICFFLKP